MAVKRIDLSPERGIWEDAEYGEDVRGAGITSLQKTEDAINETVDEVNKAAEDVQSASAATEQVARDAAETVIRANETVDHADNILMDATEQATAAAGSAKLSESWAVGGTGGREDEDTNNSKYHSRQAETAAQNAKEEADRASMYANFVTPDFIMANNRVYINQNSTVAFGIWNNKLYFKLPA